MSEVGASSKYWRKRFEILEKRANLKSQSHIKSMEQQYAVAKKTTEKELAVLYNRLAGNNGLPSIGEAKKLLTKNELKDFHMTLQEYTALAKENGITGDWTKQLENASLKYRISRLEAMKIQLEQQANILMAKETNAIEKAVKEAFENSYYGAGFEIAKGTSVGKTLFRIDDKTINTVIHKPWAADGKNFSDRVWGQHRPQLVKSLHTKLTSAIMRGEGPDKAIKEITGAFDVSMSSAARLVQTEEAYFSSVAQRQCFNDLDVEEYEIIATLDSHTSDICQNLDGKVYKMDEFEAGVTAPPFHPRCRTTTAPYFSDEVSTRAARNPETGKTEQVPSNMTYQQWRNEYVKDPEAWKAKQDKKEAEAKIKAEQEAASKAEAKKAAEVKKNQKTVDELDQKEYTGLFKGVPYYKDIPVVNYPDTITPAEYGKNINAIKVAKKYHKWQMQIGVGDQDGHKKALSEIKQLEAEGKKYAKSMEALGGKYKSPTILAKEAAQKAAEDAEAKAAAEKAAKKAAEIEKMKATKAANAAKKKELQNEIKYLESKQYEGIWYNQTVTPADYAAKKDSIAAKKSFYDQKINDGLDVEKHTKLKVKLEKFETDGKMYEAAQAELAKLTPKPKAKKVKLDDPNAYSDARKAAAYDFDDSNGGLEAADKILRKKSGEVWLGATDEQRKAAYRYTGRDYKKYNEPLYGKGKDGKRYAPGTLSINDQGKGKAIRDLTDMISKSSYDFDIYLYRGASFNQIAQFLGVDANVLRNMTEKDLQKFVGRSGTFDSFSSYSIAKIAKGKGFSGKPVQIKAIAPKGTNFFYAEPISRHGFGKRMNWDGVSGQAKIGEEAEAIVQRGAYHKIKKIEVKEQIVDGIRKNHLYIEMEIHPEKGYNTFQQHGPMR